MTPRTLPDLTCKYCGKTDSTKNRRNTFCNNICKSSFYHDAYIADWKSGKESGHHGVNNSLSGHIRKYLIEKNGCRCWKCGWEEVHPVTGKVPVQWNHIDGDSTNSSEENLELICPNCHSLTPNFGALNKGKSTRNKRRIGSLVDRNVANVD